MRLEREEEEEEEETEKTRKSRRFNVVVSGLLCLLTTYYNGKMTLHSIACFYRFLSPTASVFLLLRLYNSIASTSHCR